MGVYIKGMDMPKGCYECPLMDGEYGNCKVGATGLYDPYMEDCPLTEVPEPHGRLVDADVLLEAMRTDIMGGLNYEWFIRETPTIIERSK